MTDTNRMTEQERKNGSYNRPPGRIEQDRQRGYDQDNYSAIRDDREERFEDRGRGGYGHPSDQLGFGRSSYEAATDPEYWRDRADRFNRSGAQGQGDWNERLWRSARGRERSGYDDRGQHAPDWRESQFGKGPKGYKRSDERIAEDINECLTDDHRIDASDIEVKVQDGEVSLTGTVSDRRCRREVEDLVESISGVSDVSNQLKVQRSNETTIERGSSRSATNPATKSSSASRPGGSGGA